MGSGEGVKVGVGVGRGRVLGLYADDPVLSWVGTVGLAAVSGSALVIDLVGPSDHGDRSLKEIVDEGPRLVELNPGRAGIAMVSGMDLTTAALSDAVEKLRRSWPALVVRSDGRTWQGSTVPYKLLYPGVLAPTDPRPAVWQACRSLQKPPGPGPILPPLRPTVVRAMLNLRVPRPRRWVDSWQRIWEMPWA
jgi:hypothetical protein